MARIQQEGSLPGKSADAGYQAAEQVLAGAGYDLIKRRPMAWLLIARRSLESASIELHFAARPGPSAGVTLSLSSDELGPEALQSEAHKLLQAIANS